MVRRIIVEMVVQIKIKMVKTIKVEKLIMGMMKMVKTIMMYMMVNIMMMMIWGWCCVGDIMRKRSSQDVLLVMR